MRPSMYTRPDKPKYIPVTRREDIGKIVAPPVPEVIAVDKSTECHVTPAEVARLMVFYLGLETGKERVLEPEVGTGNLVQALLDAGHPADKVTAVELNVQLSRRVRERFDNAVEVIQGDFLTEPLELFDRIVMNPPFRNVKTHVAAAVKHLEPGGICVALVPSTFHWDGMETLEHLDNTTFASAKVITKIVRITNRG